MTRRRFFAPSGAFNFENQTVLLTAEEARHLRDALRLNRGDVVFVFNGTGSEYRCVVSHAGRDTIGLDLQSEVEPARPESQLKLTLAVALLKGEKFDLVVQKATELGVFKVIPVLTSHADIQLRNESDANKRVMRWQRIALEATKQSGRAVVPEVTQAIAIGSLLEQEDLGRRLMFSERDGKSLNEVVDKQSVGETMTALIGSEGGWADEEIEAASVGGWGVVTLGGRILRAETAAIAVTAILQNSFGDLK
jgi:16S rRNA (uracil1498-N3)-methyltransferase